MIRPVAVWEFRCHASCDEWFTSNDGLNQTIWDMRDAGWLVYITESGDEERVFCPDHVDGYPLTGEIWLVECDECDYSEEFPDPDEAAEDAKYHNKEHSRCDCHWHNATVISPEEQAQRRLKWKQYQKDAEERRKEQLAHERYVDYLISQDQENRRRDMQESTKPIMKYQIGQIIAFALLVFAAVVLASLLLTGCGKAAEPFKDAQRGNTNDDPADTITFPDGFSNVATKCDHGNRVYVIFKQDASYGSVAVVPNAEGC